MILRAAVIAILAWGTAAGFGAVPAAASSCAPGAGLGVSRVIEIDTANGPLYGDFTKYAREETFLGPKEVVLTFDDGPMPWITKSILDTLDRYCTKATFFSVGKMALAYPASVRDVMARGHTLGGHTHTHPLNIPRLGRERAVDEIERGMAAIALAAGKPIAPFFRFPGLNDSPDLLHHLQTRGIGAFTVDVVSNDSYIGDAGRLISRTMEHTERRNGGILLFHDIKAVTARALPTILEQLKARGYKVVHLVPKSLLKPLAQYEAELAPKLAKVSTGKDGKPPMLPFYGDKSTMRAANDAEPRGAEVVAGGGASGAGSASALAGGALVVTALAPAARDRFASVSRTAAVSASSSDDASPRRTKRVRASAASPVVGGWVARVRRPRDYRY